MCCNRINTDALLANLFAVQDGEPWEERNFSMEFLKNYVEFLSKMFPEYLATDFCEQAVRECVAKYPTLYQIAEADDDDFTVQASEKRPNLKYFNAAYSASISKYIEQITNAYLKGQPVHG